MCHTCKNYFNKPEQKIPPSCILNNLELDKRWPEIDKLGQYGLLLVKRAHGFQRITTCGTVASRKIPSHQKLRKAKGSALHIPIDTNATLKEIDQIIAFDLIFHLVYIFICFVHLVLFKLMLKKNYMF